MLGHCIIEFIRYDKLCLKKKKYMEYRGVVRTLEEVAQSLPSAVGRIWADQWLGDQPSGFPHAEWLT